MSGCPSPRVVVFPLGVVESTAKCGCGLEADGPTKQAAREALARCHEVNRQLAAGAARVLGGAK